MTEQKSRDEGHANAVQRAVSSLNEAINKAVKDGLRVEIDTRTSNRVGTPPIVIVTGQVSRLYVPDPEPRLSQTEAEARDRAVERAWQNG